MLDYIMDNERETRDNIGEQDTNRQLILKRNIEKFFLEDGALIIETRTIGNAGVLGHPINAKLGTMILGVGTMGSWIVARVVNPNKIWREHFRDTEFKDTTNTTADWDTTNFYCDFTANEIMQTSVVFGNNESITKGKVMANESSGSDIDYFLSIDGGLSWTQVENNTETILAPNEIRVKIDTTNHPAGRQDIVLSAAGTVSGSAYESYTNTGLISITAPIHPYIVGGIVYDTDGSSPKSGVWLRAYNESTKTFSCTTKDTGSTGKFLFDCRGFGAWNNGDYIRFTIIGGSGSAGQELKLKAIARKGSRITDLKVQYWA